MGVNVLVVKKPSLNSSASTTWTVVELCIVKSCGTVMATMGVEECELTFGLSGTASRVSSKVDVAANCS